MTIISSHRRTARRLVVAALVGAVSLTACGDDSTSATTTAASSGASTASTAAATSVGTVDGTNAFIALQEQKDGSVLVYVCDGATVWDYLQGNVTGSNVKASDAVEGSRVAASREGTGWKGTVRLPDGEHAFTTIAATGNAGLFSRATQPVKGLVRIGGWIRLADGRVQGKEVVATTSGTTGSTSAGGADVGGGTTVPPDAQPTSLGGLIRCGIAGAKVKIAQNHLDRDPNYGNIANLVNAQESARQICAVAAN